MVHRDLPKNVHVDIVSGHGSLFPWRIFKFCHFLPFCKRLAVNEPSLETANNVVLGKTGYIQGWFYIIIALSEGLVIAQAQSTC